MIKVRCSIVNAIIIMLLVISLDAIAQSEEPTVSNRFGIGARTMGMGGAFIGVAAGVVERGRAEGHLRNAR